MNNMLQNIWTEIMYSTLGGEINSEASNYYENHIDVHCWDGRRFRIDCIELSSVPAYDPQSGLQITD